jgi:hypothetical protein
MGVESFKPVIWSSSIIADIAKKLVYGNIAHRDFEGEVVSGNSLKLSELGDITVSDYTDSSGLTWQDLDGTVRELKIDQQKAFSVNVPDIDKIQSKPNLMAAASAKAAHAIVDAVDQYIAKLYDEAGALDSSNLGSVGSAVAVYGTDMPEVLSYMHTALDENNAPRDGRWVVASPLIAQYLVYGNVVQGAGFDNPNAGALSTGQIARTMGFDIFMSNNVQSASSSEIYISFGTRDALAYVGQVETIETVRRESYFMDGLRGLYVFGAKAMRPDHLGLAVLNPSGMST